MILPEVNTRIRAVISDQHCADLAFPRDELYTVSGKVLCHGGSPGQSAVGFSLQRDDGAVGSGYDDLWRCVNSNIVSWSPEDYCYPQRPTAEQMYEILRAKDV